VIFASTITAPDGSVTFPTILPKPCAEALPAQVKRQNKHNPSINDNFNLVFLRRSAAGPLELCAETHKEDRYRQRKLMERELVRFSAVAVLLNIIPPLPKRVFTVGQRTLSKTPRKIPVLESRPAAGFSNSRNQTPRIELPLNF